MNDNTGPLYIQTYAELAASVHVVCRHRVLRRQSDVMNQNNQRANLRLEPYIRSQGASGRYRISQASGLVPCSLCLGRQELAV